MGVFSYSTYMKEYSSNEARLRVISIRLHSILNIDRVTTTTPHLQELMKDKIMYDT